MVLVLTMGALFAYPSLATWSTSPYTFSPKVSLLNNSKGPVMTSSLKVRWERCSSMTVHTQGMHQHLTHCQELQSKGNFCGHGLVRMHASSERCYRAAKFSGWLSLLAVLQVLLLWVPALKRILLRIRVLSQGQTLKQVGGQDSSHHYWLLAEFSVSAPYM